MSHATTSRLILLSSAALLAALLGASCADRDVVPAQPSSSEISLDVPAQIDDSSEVSLDELGQIGHSSEVSFDELAQLGYIEWTEDADPSLSGVVRWNNERAQDGYNLFTNLDRRLFVMAMDGTIVHEWQSPAKSHYFELAGMSDVVVMAGRAGVYKLDRDSTTLWHVDVHTHHDLAPRPDGGFIVPEWREVGDYRGHRVRFDGLCWISAAGEIERRWWTYDHLDKLQQLHAPTPAEAKLEGKSQKFIIHDYYHMNTVELLPASELAERDSRFKKGNVLVCLRNADLVFVLDPRTDAITWSWGPGELDWPHMPTLVEGRNLLIFDNRAHEDASRVIELDPSEERIMWRYGEGDDEHFYSKLRGSSQRMENGNTLICEADAGHVFEVTHEGEVVWEYWAPMLDEGKRQAMYRMVRVSEERVAALLGR